MTDTDRDAIHAAADAARRTVGAPTRRLAAAITVATSTGTDPAAVRRTLISRGGELGAAARSSSGWGAALSTAAAVERREPGPDRGAAWSAARRALGWALIVPLEGVSTRGQTRARLAVLAVGLVQVEAARTRGWESAMVSSGWLGEQLDVAQTGGSAVLGSLVGAGVLTRLRQARGRRAYVYRLRALPRTGGDTTVVGLDATLAAMADGTPDPLADAVRGLAASVYERGQAGALAGLLALAGLDAPPGVTAAVLARGRAALAGLPVPDAVERQAARAEYNRAHTAAMVASREARGRLLKAAGAAHRAIVEKIGQPPIRLGATPAHLEAWAGAYVGAVRTLLEAGRLPEALVPAMAGMTRMALTSRRWPEPVAVQVAEAVTAICRADGGMPTSDGAGR